MHRDKTAEIKLKEFRRRVRKRRWCRRLSKAGPYIIINFFRLFYKSWLYEILGDQTFSFREERETLSFLLQSFLCTKLSLLHGEFFKLTDSESQCLKLNQNVSFPKITAQYTVVKFKGRTGRCQNWKNGTFLRSFQTL